MRSPDWSSTAIFLAWDDWGGFYDHVSRRAWTAQGYGLRVPGARDQPLRQHGLHRPPDAQLRRLPQVHRGRLPPRPAARPAHRRPPRLAARRPRERQDPRQPRQDFDFNQKPRPPSCFLSTRRSAEPRSTPRTATRARPNRRWRGSFPGGSPHCEASPGPVFRSDPERHVLTEDFRDSCFSRPSSLRCPAWRSSGYACGTPASRRPRRNSVLSSSSRYLARSRAFSTSRRPARSDSPTWLDERRRDPQSRSRVEAAAVPGPDRRALHAAGFGAGRLREYEQLSRPGGAAAGLRLQGCRAALRGRGLGRALRLQGSQGASERGRGRLRDAEAAVALSRTGRDHLRRPSVDACRGALHADAVLDALPGESVEYADAVFDHGPLEVALRRLYPEVPLARLRYIDRGFARKRLRLETERRDSLVFRQLEWIVSAVRERLRLDGRREEIAEALP